jgi:predicted amidohydrolase
LPCSILLLGSSRFADQEKFYFSPGDTGFKVFQTRYADIGVLICWDQ